MKCEKCSYDSESNKKIPDTDFYLCSICSQFAPFEKEKLDEYLQEKINSNILESFRKFSQQKLKQGMEKKALQGNIMSRAAFGYKIISKQLIPDEEKKLIVEKLFLDFLNNNTSLNQLAKTYGFSVNGIKKILRNFTYIGKVKFARQISQGNHQPIITAELFNKVQSKLESLKIK